MEHTATILIVDDNPENLYVLGSILKQEFRVRVAPNGARALEIVLAESPPDLILLDIMMPDISGFDVCQRLKNTPERSHIPIIFISALGEASDEALGLSIGAIDYITKPITPDLVLARVRNHIKLFQQQQRLEESYRQLRELETLRDNLVHMLVHDLRSPLSAVNTTIELVLEEEIDNSIREDLESARDAAIHVQNMVTDVLEVSRLETGVKLDYATCDPKKLTLAAIKELRGLSMEHQIQTVLADGPPIKADQKLIFRVLINILSNALKFSPKGSTVCITTRYEKTHISFEFKDKGPFIPPELREIIFQKFVQAPDSKMRSSGLGLTFCELAVESHGGRIGVDSVKGEGNLFWFTLPLSPAP